MGIATCDAHATPTFFSKGFTTILAPLSLDSDEYDLQYERDESVQQKVHEETCGERIKGATIGFLIAACLSVLAYTLLTILLPQNTECPMNRYSCRKEHFLKVYKSIQVVEKFRDTNRRKILSSVKAGLSERIFVPVLFTGWTFFMCPNTKPNSANQ